eukprot:scaffold75470_cov51-Attheya_sp.AAC.2
MDPSLSGTNQEPAVPLFGAKDDSRICETTVQRSRGVGGPVCRRCVGRGHIGGVGSIGQRHLWIRVLRG